MLKKLTPDLHITLRFYELNRPPANLVTPGAPVGFVEVPQTMYKLRHEKPHPQPLPGNPNCCPVEVGTHAHPERNFYWLPWIPGKVSFMKVNQPFPIITGLMSGCWLVLFTLNGQTCFGHIGTDLGPNTANSLDAKNAWKIAKNARKIIPVNSFNPVAHGRPSGYTMGALSAHRHFYTIRLTDDRNTYKVVETVRVNVMTPDPVLP
jgi:hypothetical protein